MFRWRFSKFSFLNIMQNQLIQSRLGTWWTSCSSRYKSGLLPHRQYRPRLFLQLAQGNGEQDLVPWRNRQRLDQNITLHRTDDAATQACLNSAQQDALRCNAMINAKAHWWRYPQDQDIRTWAFTSGWTWQSLKSPAQQGREDGFIHLRCVVTSTLTAACSCPMANIAPDGSIHAVSCCQPGNPRQTGDNCGFLDKVN